MKRGDVYDARLDPTEGSEQAGTRPVVIVSRDTINTASSVVIAVPFTSAAHVKRSYPHTVLIPRGEGGLSLDSIALAGQMRSIAKSRLTRRRGALRPETLSRLDKALRIALDL